MQFDEPLDKSQPEAGSLVSLGRVFLGLLKNLENQLLVTRGDADSVILDRDLH